MKFGFIAKHRGIRPADWLCGALGVSRGGFYAWLTRPRSRRSRSNEELGAKVRASFLASDRTYGSRRVWHDLLAEGIPCSLHRIERLMRLQALKARPRRRRLPPDLGERQVAAVAPNVLDRSFEAPAPNRIICSMSQSGNAWDNAAMESFFSSLKTERTARKTYRTRDDAKADVFDYIECFYNAKRRHSTIGYRSPMEFEMQAGLA